MTSNAPPSRYRVVEKDRRLVVIDTRSGAPVAGETAGEAPTPLGPERIAFDGRSILATRRLYDDKAPRRLMLDEGTTRAIGIARAVGIVAAGLVVIALIAAPWLAVLALPIVSLLGNANGRARLRARITRWLDRYDTAASAG